MKYWRVPIIAFILFSGELFGWQNQDSTTMETVKAQMQPGRLKQTQISIKEKLSDLSALHYLELKYYENY